MYGYGTYVGEEHWWRKAPAVWRHSREEWDLLPERLKQDWWRYQQQQWQQPYQQPYYQQPYQHQYQQYPGYRWVPGYGGRPGHWARERTW